MMIDNSYSIGDKYILQEDWKYKTMPNCYHTLKSGVIGIVVGKRVFDKIAEFEIEFNISEFYSITIYARGK